MGCGGKGFVVPVFAVTMGSFETNVESGAPGTYMGTYARITYAHCAAGLDLFQLQADQNFLNLTAPGIGATLNLVRTQMVGRSCIQGLPKGFS